MVNGMSEIMSGRRKQNPGEGVVRKALGGLEELQARGGAGGCPFLASGFL